jgi:hypothetical protein
MYMKNENSQYRGVSNAAVGSGAPANSTGSFNTALGSGAGFNAASGDGNVYIAVLGSPSPESNHSYIRNINTTSVSGGGTDTVTVTSISVTTADLLGPIRF